MTNQEILINLKQSVKELYDKNERLLPFHGWHHISFVHDKSLEFAKELNADNFLVSASSLTHDLNYLVKINSKVGDGKDLRQKILSNLGINNNSVSDIEKIVNEASTTSRHENISAEAKSLSDADTLFKALPITPIIFANLYAKEQHINLETLAKKIVKEQTMLFEKGIYFYSNAAKAHLNWAKVNIELWKNVQEFFNNDNFSNYFNEFSKYDDK